MFIVKVQLVLEKNPRPDRSHESLRQFTNKPFYPVTDFFLPVAVGFIVIGIKVFSTYVY